MARMAAGVRKKENGRYEKRFTVAGQRFSVSGSSSKECIEKEQQIRQQVAEGSYTANKNITLSEYFVEWENDRRASVKASTTESIHRTFAGLIEPMLGKVKIQKIEKRQIVVLQNQLMTDHKATTVNLVLTVLKAILNGAVADEIITRNPAATVKPVSTKGLEKASKSIHRALTREEQALFLDAIKDEWMYEFTAFSFSTGLRLMECNALTWGDIDYINGVIHVNKTLSKNYTDGGYRVTSPKSETSERDIPLNNTIKKLLASQREKQFALRGGKAVGMESRIFTGASGGVIQSSPFRDMVNRTLKRIEQEKGITIEPFTHHATRATFATRYCETTRDLQTLKVLLGHSSFKMTADLYSHVLPDEKQKGMDMMDDILAI